MADLECISLKEAIRVYLRDEEFFYLDEDNYSPFHKTWTKAKEENRTTVIYGRYRISMIIADQLMLQARDHFGAPNDPVGFLPAE